MRHYIAAKNRIKANRNWHERHDERDPLYFLPKSDKEEKDKKK